jgi:DNA-binding NtrC family response regulator
LSQRLHTLQTGEVSRTGGCEIIRVDVRVIASAVHGGESSDHLSQELKRLNAVGSTADIDGTSCSART